MNGSQSNDTPLQGTPTGLAGKRPYIPPVLTLFGHVAALTRSGNCSSNSDGNNGFCTSGGAISMGMAASDRRLKDRVLRVGEHPLGFGLYLFEYKPEYQTECGVGRHFGVMADEVEPIFPKAIHERPDGFKLVDYTALGITTTRH